MGSVWQDQQPVASISHQGQERRAQVRGPLRELLVRRAETASPPSRRELDAAAAGDGLEVVFQPIVSLQGGELVGFEALARWTHLGDGTAGDVFAHAARTGRAGALERKCIETAVVGALDAGLPAGSAVFINCEATTPYLRLTDSQILAHGAERFQIVFEVTERSLLTHPPDLLRKVVAMRGDGFSFALDDVGADLDSLALLDVLAPDVIKLDLALVQSQPHYRQARTWAAVLAHHEHAGALVLAEGIETAEHLHRALALGATLGQGFRFGRPGPLSPGASTGALPPAIRTQRPCVDPGSPFVAVGGNPMLRRQRKDTVLALSLALEQQALEAPDPPMVLTAVQRAQFFTGQTRSRYQRLAAHSPLVAVFGRDVVDDLGCGIRGVRLAHGDSLESQWIVLALGANIAAAVVSREVIDLECASNDSDRRFDVALTNDRALVTRVARQLLTRMLPLPAQ
jgi:EAL domain-containing protein (putative c-di-GMP-specific phosphodiesterase class I)